MADKVLTMGAAIGAAQQVGLLLARVSVIFSEEP
jgi:hypothetical protein